MREASEINRFTPMSSKPKAKLSRKRYSSDEKGEIIAFVKKHDVENGRGGKSAAVAKYGISPISLSSWIKAAGVPASTGKKRGRKPGSKNASKVISVSPAKNGSLSIKLRELGKVAGQIEKAESELGRLRARFESLKAAL